MKVKKKDTKIIARTICHFAELKNSMQAHGISKSQLYKILKNTTAESLVLLSSLGGIPKKNVSLYLETLKDVKTFIDGSKLKDLGFIPSKDFKAILERLLEKRLDNQIKTYADELKEVHAFFNNITAPDQGSLPPKRR